MAYDQFTLLKVVADFGLTVTSVPDLFPDVRPVPLPPAVRGVLGSNLELAVSGGTEAARAQLLIAPLLADVWRAGAYRVALFIGARFDVDEAAGLVGVCDYIFGDPPQMHFVTSPVMMIVEAKNEDVLGGLGQCAAAMVAAARFNDGKSPPVPVIHGAVSDGERWRFLRLAGKNLCFELGDRLIGDPDQIFGILLHIVGVAPATPAAA